jgi:hypothetical protein
MTHDEIVNAKEDRAKKEFGRLGPMGRAKWALENCNKSGHPSAGVCLECCAEAIDWTIDSGVKLAGGISDQALKLEDAGVAWKKRAETAELQIKALKAILRKVEYVNDGEVGALWCPVCWAGKPAGHSEGCDLGHALHGAFPPTSDKQIEPSPKYTFEGASPKKGDRYMTHAYIREWDGEQWITLPLPAQALAPSGSCPCRMDGEVLVACERHAIKQECTCPEVKLHKGESAVCPACARIGP